MTNVPNATGASTEADIDVAIVQPYLRGLGIQSGELRAQRTFSLRLGRGMIHNVGD